MLNLGTALLLHSRLCGLMAYSVSMSCEGGTLTMCLSAGCAVPAGQHTEPGTAAAVSSCNFRCRGATAASVKPAPSAQTTGLQACSW